MNKNKKIQKYFFEKIKKFWILNGNRDLENCTNRKYCVSDKRKQQHIVGKNKIKKN